MRLLLKLCCFLTFFCNWGSTRQCLRLFQKIDSPNEICIVENANDLSFNPTNESGSFAKLLKSPKQMSCIPTSSTRSKKVKKSSAKKNPDIINYFESQGEWLESQKEIDNLNSRKPKTKAKDLRSKSEKSKEKISDISKNLVVDRNSRSLPPKKSPPLGAKAIKSKSLPHLSKYSFAEAYEALYLTDSPRRPKILPLNSHIAQPKSKISISPSPAIDKNPTEHNSYEVLQNFLRRKSKSLSPSVTSGSSSKHFESKQVDLNIPVTPHKAPKSEIEEGRMISKLTDDKSIGELSFRFNLKDNQPFEFQPLEEKSLGSTDHFW